MSQDSFYKAEPFIYKSQGLWARPADDQMPQYAYLQYLNILEREENAVSSRYGTVIVNRDPSGVGTSNHYFPSPVTTITRLNYQSNAWRYAGLANGNLYRRAGNTQGAYSLLTLPKLINGSTLVLSGNAFDSFINSTFQTSLPFLFIYDENGSIKDIGTGSPQLTGIDPPPYTANSVPYSPLLSIIDTFATGNSYATSNVGSWSYVGIETLSATSGQIVPATDFTEFFGVQVAGGPSYTPSTSSATVNVSSPPTGSTATSSAVSGFASAAISGGEQVNVTISLSASIDGTGGAGGNGGGYVNFQYSSDGGTTWTSFYGFASSVNGTQNLILPSTNVPLTLSSLSNLSYLQFQIVVGASSGPTESVTTIGTISSVVAVITSPGAFGPITNGMLTIFNTNTTVNIPIVSVVSSDLVGSLYEQLLITTVSAHGLSANAEIAIYGSSNDQLDGFYKVIAAPTTTTLTVAFVSSVYLSATGGVLQGGAAAPSTAVLTNLYSTPYPSQMSAWGFYQQVPASTTSFPISSWGGTVAASATGSIGNTVTLDLSQNNQVQDGDLIVLTLQVGTPANVENIRLQFDVDGSNYTTSYYYANIVPAYYQGNIANTVSAYDTTQSQILADTLGLITGQPPSTTTAQLQPSNFSTGNGSWITVYIPRGNFLPVGNAGQQGFNWANITGWQVLVTTNANVGGSSINMNGLYLQWGYGPSSFAGVGYDYRYTYYNANTGTESSPCPEQQYNEQFGYLSSLSAPFYLRQAVQVTGDYSFDPQVTHVRIYRRGGTLSSNWVQIDQIPNYAQTYDPFIYKDVTADAFIQQAQPLVLDNDPPVTSSLSSPIQTTLSAATIAPGVTFYSTYGPQVITVANAGAVFVINQIVTIGNSNNLEVVSVIAGGTGQFSAIVRLQHNAGEQVNVYAVPRQPCNLCAVAYNQVWLAGDPNNPHYLYYSKKGLPENFGPQNYIPVSTPDDPINAVINWRGTLVVGTLKSWFIIPGGSTPYPQPTGSVHGIVAQQGWIEVEGSIYYQAVDGLREFTGADGVYKTLPVEWIFRGNPQCLPPQANQADFSQSILAYYNNSVYCAYVSTTNSGQVFRLTWDTMYSRWRMDDVGATAMFWEKDINTLLVGKQISTGNYAVCQDQIGDYDDGGWVAGALVETPINLTIQHPYRDLGKPHDQKNFNGLETDVNTMGQTLNTTLLFDDGTISVPLASINTGTTRQKAESIVNLGEGQEAYRISILHTMAVTTAITLYQESIDAAVLPPQMASWDTYDIKFNTDDSKFAKESYWDYTSPVPINVSLYADGSYPIPYFTFQLPARPNRGVIRVRHSNVNSGTTAFTFRTWRIIALVDSSTNPLQTFQFWANPKVLWKPIGVGHSYQTKELEV